MSLRTFSGLAFICALAACSPSQSDALNRPSNGAGSGGSSSATGGATSGGGSSFGGTGFGGSFIDVGGQSTGNGGNAGQCASSVYEPEEIIVQVPVEVVTYEPIALFIMQDRSSSMVGYLGTGDANSWPTASSSMTTFANDAASAGLDVGLGFFPPMSGAAACDGSNCGVPVVPIASLPGNAQALTTAMQSANPSSSFLPLFTPTECALRGMINTCIAHKTQTGEDCVAILITDGAPTECNGDTAALAQIVADGLTQGIQTFVLGMQGANFALLDTLAQAGGTDCDPNSPAAACNLTGGGTGFIDALNLIRNSVVTTIIEEQIQETTLECSWGIPSPAEGGELDPDKVNVKFSADGIAEQSIGRVPSEAECPNYQGGWFYDAAVPPTTISVCPESCDTIKASTSARIDIQLGCVTEYSPVR